MERRQFDHLVEQLQQLTRRQCQKLLSLLTETSKRDRTKSVFWARDRTGQTLDFVTGNGPVTKSQLHQHLLPALDPDVLLVTDANAAYR